MCWRKAAEFDILVCMVKLFLCVSVDCGCFVSHFSLVSSSFKIFFPKIFPALLVLTLSQTQLTCLGVTFILILKHQMYLLDIFSFCRGNLFFTNRLLCKMLVPGIWNLCIVEKVGLFWFVLFHKINV